MSAIIIIVNLSDKLQLKPTLNNKKAVNKKSKIKCIDYHNPNPDPNPTVMLKLTGHENCHCNVENYWLESNC